MSSREKAIFIGNKSKGCCASLNKNGLNKLIPTIAYNLCLSLKFKFAFQTDAYNYGKNYDIEQFD